MMIHYHVCPSTQPLGRPTLQLQSTTQVSETVNKSNADHAVLFEAVNLVLSHGSTANPGLRTQVY